ncbi:MAG: hypothetical protein DRQ08_08480 [Candidatus Latescibacterota bacterium]|nr:MAG: hypothetical protein DRQ08_08480 [Candidatus Latescibacterota bacterium]
MASIEGGYFRTEGEFFFPVGVNYLPSKHDCRMWREWDPQEIERDFRNMGRLGINTVRIILLWPDFEPEPGRYDQEAIRRLEEMVEIAKRNGIKLLPTLVTGDLAGVKWVPSWAIGKSIYSAEVIERQKGLVKEIAGRFGDEQAIFAWDLSNEPSYWEEPDDPGWAANWTRSLAEAVREVDRNHPVTVGLDQHNIAGESRFRIEPVAPYLDFLSIHTYPKFLPQGESPLSFRGTYFPAYCIRFCRLGKPVLLEEFGLSTGTFSEEDVGAYYEVVMFSALVNGAAGVMSWSWSDEVRTDRCPYDERFPMTCYGITRADGTEKPAALRMRDFSKVIRDISPFELDEGEVGLLLPANVYNQDVGRATFNCFVICKMAGLSPKIVRKGEDLRAFKLLIVPLLFSHKYSLEDLGDFVGAGGTMLCSLGPGYVPLGRLEEFLREVLRLEVEPRASHVEGELKLIASSALRNLTLCYDAEGGIAYHPIRWTEGDVLAEDLRGNPAIVYSECGRGRAITSVLPLEHLLSSKVHAYERRDETYKIYRYAADLAGLEVPVVVESPFVEVGTLTSRAGRLMVFVNHLGEAVSANVRTSFGGACLREVYRAEGKRTKAGADGSFRLDLAPYEAKVLAIEEVLTFRRRCAIFRCQM